jgi:hypothetical protein
VVVVGVAVVVGVVGATVVVVVVVDEVDVVVDEVVAVSSPTGSSAWIVGAVSAPSRNNGASVATRRTP